MTSAKSFWWTPQFEQDYQRRVRDDARVHRLTNGRLSVYVRMHAEFDDECCYLFFNVHCRPYTAPRCSASFVSEHVAADLAQATMLVRRLTALLSTEPECTFVDLPRDEHESLLDATMPDTRGVWTLPWLALDDGDAALAVAVDAAFVCWLEANTSREGPSVARALARDDIMLVLSRKYIARVSALKERLRALSEQAINELGALVQSDALLAECLRRRSHLGVSESSHWLLPTCTRANVNDVELMNLLN